MNFTEVASLSANTSYYTASGLSAGVTYHFRVRAYGEGGNSAYPNQASAATKRK